MIKIIMVKYKIFQNEQKQILQSVIRRQRVYLLSAIVLCILTYLLLIMVIVFLSASNEQVLFKLVI